MEIFCLEQAETKLLKDKPDPLLNYLAGKTTAIHEHDHTWQIIVEVIIKADPRFTAKQKRIIEQNFQMENGIKVIKSRAALVNYLLRKLRIDSFKNSPKDEQIALTQNHKKISPYLPHTY
jgi:hypothetical protein